MIEQKSERSNRFHMLVLILLLVSVVAFSVSFYVDSKKTLDVQVLNLSLTIGNVTGFDVSKDRLGLGELTPGTSAKRDDVYVSNPYDFPVTVYFTAEGNITSFLTYTKEIRLNPGDRKRFSVETKVISDEPRGYYDGKLIITFRKT